MALHVVALNIQGKETAPNYSATVDLIPTRIDLIHKNIYYTLNKLY